jgi:hypothetical protein
MKTNDMKFIALKISPPFRAAIITFALATTWIGGLDHALATLKANPLALLLVISAKGWLFVAGTSLLVFWMARRSQRQLLSASQNLRDDQERVITRLLSTMQMSLQGHGDDADRVAHMAVGLARLAGVGGDTLHDLKVGALLRDVGHLAVPKAPVDTRWRLSPKEMAQMRRHPQIGYDLLEQARFPATVLHVVRAHHERWDGLGYPLGLAGEAIPLAARIVGIVDVWNALSSDRGCRAGWAEAEVLAYLEHGAGSQFDPALTALFLAHYRQLKVAAAPPGTSVEHADIPAWPLHGHKESPSDKVRSIRDRGSIEIVARRLHG